MTRKCHNCNEINEENQDFCVNCNEPLFEEEIVKKKDIKVKPIITGVLSVSPKTIEMTELKRSESKETYILVARSDFESDKFSGTITPPDIPGFKIKAEKFEGLRNVINIQIEAKQLKVGETYEGFVDIKTGIGEAKIPVKLAISLDSPQLDVDYNQLQINMGKRENSASFCVTNLGMGTLMGTAKTNTSWLMIEDSSFSLSRDGSFQIDVKVDKKALRSYDVGGRMSLEGNVRVESNAGDLDIKLILYLPPRKSLEDFKPYIPYAAAAIALIFLFFFFFPIVKKLILPAQNRKTGLWGEMMGQSGNNKMNELKWNPLVESEKLIFTSVKGKDGKLVAFKLNNSSMNIINSFQINRLYTPACSPDGLLYAYGLPTQNAVTDKEKARIINLAIGNDQKKDPDVLTEYKDVNNEIKIATDPVWSPDGLKIAFVKLSSPDAIHGEVMVVDYDNADPYSVSVIPKQNLNITGRNPRWSHDGKKLLIESLEKEVYIIELQGRDKSPVIFRLTNKNEYNASSPCWMAGDNSVVFCRDGSVSEKDIKDKSDIYMIKSDGTELKPVIERPAFEELNPDCTSDGKLIAFDSKEYGAGKNGDIYIVGLDGSNLKAITHTGDDDEKNPVWSYDGKKLAYLCNDGTDWDIYIVKIDDKELKPVRITNDEADEGVPVWWSSDCFNKRLDLIKALEGQPQN